MGVGSGVGLSFMFCGFCGAWRESKSVEFVLEGVCLPIWWMGLVLVGAAWKGVRAGLWTRGRRKVWPWEGAWSFRKRTLKLLLELEERNITRELLPRAEPPAPAALTAQEPS